MRRELIRLSGISVMFVWAGCSDSNAGDRWSGPCAETPPAEGCGTTYSTALDCAAGLHCGVDKTCTAECTADRGCADTERCSDRGRCEFVGRPGTDASFGAGDGGTPICADVRVLATRTKTTVILIIDKSASMPQTFEGGVSRWDTVRTTLLDPTSGVLPPLAAQVRFGVALYTATNGGGGDEYEGEPAVVCVPGSSSRPPPSTTWRRSRRPICRAAGRRMRSSRLIRTALSATTPRQATRSRG